MEKDAEVKGEGNSINYKYRMHDPRLARFFQQDPLRYTYPELTPYQFCSNSPIYRIEVEGLEGVKHVDHLSKTTTITVDFYYVAKNKGRKDKNGLKNGKRKTRFTDKEVKILIQGIYDEFNRQGFVDNYYSDIDDQPYKVELNINAIGFESKREMQIAYTKEHSYTNDPSDPRYLLTKVEGKAMKIYKMEPKTVYNSSGIPTGIVRGDSHTGTLRTTDINNSHTNTHEFWHNLTHNHLNAPARLRNQLNPTNQEPGHFAAGGIFIYQNTALGRSIQHLNQQNVNDALDSLPAIDVTPSLENRRVMDSISDKREFGGLGEKFEN